MTMTEIEVRNRVNELLDDENVIKICSKASRKFNKSLSQEEIDSCIMLALWRSVRNFDAELGYKFTSYLWNGVVMECKGCMKFNVAPSRKYVGVTFNSDVMDKTLKSQEDWSQVKRFEAAEIEEEIQGCEDPELIHDRFYNNMSISDLAEKHNLSRREINKKIEKILNYLSFRLD